MEVTVLQTVRLKGGMADLAVVATVAGRSEDDAHRALDDLLRAGYVDERRGRYRATPEGRAALDRALADERARLDGGAVAAGYDRFTELNRDLKVLATDWQLRGGQPNDHGDAGYDARVLDGFDELHEQALPLVRHLAAAVVPRLARYPDRLTDALAQVRAGDHRFLLSPLVDSYHQVWFELHEELLGAAGLDRAREAAAGRAE
jgi:hypothetical protein